jgi:mRNA-degrading endonuclease RelE of RelBE toxin-antitoxin system
VWRVVLTTAADRAFRKVAARDRAMAGRIRDELHALRDQENPRPFLKQLEGYFPPDYSARVGDYRVVVELDEDRRLIIVSGIGLRKNVYDRR